MDSVQPLPFAEARETVLRIVGAAVPAPDIETIALDEAAGRVLARDIAADRPYPPFSRSIRDGYAVHSADFPGQVRVVGEVAAGQTFGRPLERGEAVEIMTGAPVPGGANAVIMVEHAVLAGDTVTTDRPVNPGDFIVAAGSECETGVTALRAGTRLDFGHIPALASVGAAWVEVFRRPVVSMIATGTELVPVDATPAAHQIRNSNSHSLAAQIARAGAIPRILPVAPDQYSRTRELIEEGLEADLLLVSGGVSAGKYDLVETVLSDLGAEFYFDRVRIQPGQPLVFGRVRGRFFFGLPGNPASTMVTFETIARVAIDLLTGCTQTALPLTAAFLTEPFRHKPGLTRFLPAVVAAGQVTPVTSQGSGDVFALARANAFLIAREDCEAWDTGDPVEVLML
jgi:molybdopterin molybdotransferase